METPPDQQKGAVTESAGEQLDSIMRDLDAAGAAWERAGYGYGTPEDDAREAIFARLREWNRVHGQQETTR
jgi:hypothetical protein